MNLSSSNNATPSTNPTPVAQELNVETSPSFEQYRSPLVSDYFTAPTLRSSAVAQEAEDPPEVPPLPASPTFHHTPLIAASSPVHYRSLQSTPSISPKIKAFNLGSYFPSPTAEPVSRKRYHTAPREKHRVSCCNICYCLILRLSRELLLC